MVEPLSRGIAVAASQEDRLVVRLRALPGQAVVAQGEAKACRVDNRKKISRPSPSISQKVSFGPAMPAIVPSSRRVALPMCLLSRSIFQRKRNCFPASIPFVSPGCLPAACFASAAPSPKLGNA